LLPLREHVGDEVEFVISATFTKSFDRCQQPMNQVDALRASEPIVRHIVRQAFRRTSEKWWMADNFNAVIRVFLWWRSSGRHGTTRGVPRSVWQRDLLVSVCEIVFVGSASFGDRSHDNSFSLASRLVTSSAVCIKNVLSCWAIPMPISVSAAQAGFKGYCRILRELTVERWQRFEILSVVLRQLL